MLFALYALFTQSAHAQKIPVLLADPWSGPTGPNEAPDVCAWTCDGAPTPELLPAGTPAQCVKPIAQITAGAHTCTVRWRRTFWGDESPPSNTASFTRPAALPAPAGATMGQK